MNLNLTANGKSGRDWRLLAEVVRPGSADDDWVSAGLRAALAALELPLADLERVTGAAVESVGRAWRHARTPAAAAPPVAVRVLVSSPELNGPCSCGWGYFILERMTGDGGGLDEGSRAHVIELYLYADVEAV
jgi:hypothetical protein